MKTNLLKNLSWTEFEKRMDYTKLAIIPSGAFEVYGPHLPLGTDTLVSCKIAEIVANNVTAIIGPTLEVGDSATLDEFPGTITIKPESFKNYMWDTLKSLEKWGFKDFLFINTHVGNVPIINQLSADLQRNSEIRCAQVDYWRFLKNFDEGIIETGPLAHAHASEAGTSVMLYLYPELCDTVKAVNEPPNYTDEFPDIIQYHKLTKITKSGTIGDAQVGTREKGEKIVQKSVDRILNFLAEQWGYDIENNRNYS